MSHKNTFLLRVIAARRAAWFSLLIAVAFQLLTYLGFLAIENGSLDGLIESGLYGNTTRGEIARLALVYTAAMKLINFAILIGALFLTLWVRGLRRID